jgi:hypothetical protein
MLTGNGQARGRRTHAVVIAGLGDNGTKAEFSRVSVYRVREAFHSAFLGALLFSEARCPRVMVCEATGTPVAEEPGIVVIA